MGTIEFDLKETYNLTKDELRIVLDAWGQKETKPPKKGCQLIINFAVAVHNTAIIKRVAKDKYSVELGNY